MLPIITTQENSAPFVGVPIITVVAVGRQVVAWIVGLLMEIWE